MVALHASEAPAKTIVLLLDGTSNQITKRRSHMLRLYGSLEKTETQLVYYDPGVGTFGADNAVFGFWRKIIEVVGLATGWGLAHNVKEAYRFLLQHYNEGDKVVLCGFSRGAYTARVLAGFCHSVGMIEPRNLNLLNYAFRAYKGINEDDFDTGQKTGANPFAELNLVNRVLDAPRIKIDSLLLFDTVSSMIEWGRFGPRLRSYAFSSRNPSVRAVRHALAIDERRWLFRPTLWDPGPYWGGSYTPVAMPEPQDVEQVWFSGVHSDVGGGVPEDASALGKVALMWMIEEAARLGVAFEGETVQNIVEGQGNAKYVAPDPVAKPQDSMTPFWFLAEFWPLLRKKNGWGANRAGLFGRYAPCGERRVIPAGSKIHGSVFERRGTARDYDQPNIPEDHEIV
ncbi:T6SS phospholipase effector Tle1-like catalytic domain-containing protein [Primorskyibacter sp. S187A]|uniref:T6SS phospholipase effector Tle1-like catalytic domain-containing protein n=1 Tax=Primorskyibacter sp. S187A TaxID=3415130 RepID=UPI003C7AF291